MKKVEGWGWAGSGGCDPRIEVIVKLRKKRGGGVGSEGGGGRCDPRIEVIVEFRRNQGGEGACPGLGVG